MIIISKKINLNLGVFSRPRTPSRPVQGLLWPSVPRGGHEDSALDGLRGGRRGMGRGAAHPQGLPQRADAASHGGPLQLHVGWDLAHTHADALFFFFFK